MRAPGPAQGGTADGMKQAIVFVAQRIPEDAKIVSTVHDEIVVECSEQDAETVIAEGERVLATIPGVRQVFAGKTLDESGQYRYCWRVQFASAAVVDTYRDHPLHVSYANTYFRPNAGDRVTLDFGPAPGLRLQQGADPSTDQQIAGHIS